MRCEWMRRIGDHTVILEITPKFLRLIVTRGDDFCRVEADYSMTGDGILFGRVRGVTKEGTKEGPSPGDLFSVRFELDQTTLVLCDVQGHFEHGRARHFIEGRYEPKGGMTLRAYAFTETDPIAHAPGREGG
jgi:hypothetical protein